MQNASAANTSMSPSPLFALPAEIRNRIMEFVLTSSTPLHHRPPRPRNSHQINAVRRQHRLVEEKALASNPSHPSFNQVKRVCRQLHAETAGLEIQHNAIFFESHKVRPHNRNGMVQAMYRPMRKSAEAWFFDFVTPMTPNKLSWLTTVIISAERPALSITNGAAPPMENLSMLAHFCKHNPKIKMCYQFPNFCVDYSDANPSLQYFTVGTALTMALKGDDAGFKAAGDHLPWHPWARALMAAAMVWRDTWGIDYVLRGVENFSFTPREEMRHDLLVEMLRLDALALNAGEEAGKMWAKQFLEWQADGVALKT